MPPDSPQIPIIGPKIGPIWTAEELDIARRVDDVCSMLFGGDMFVRIRADYLAVACDLDPIFARRAEGLATIDGPFRRHFEHVQTLRAARAAARAVDAVQVEATQ